MIVNFIYMICRFVTGTPGYIGGEQKLIYCISMIYIQYILQLSFVHIAFKTCAVSDQKK